MVIACTTFVFIRMYAIKSIVCRSNMIYFGTLINLMYSFLSFYPYA